MRKILFTQWFDSSTEVMSYNCYCLYKNISNTHIDHIYVFDENKSFNNIYSEKVSVIPIESRLSYSDWFYYSGQNKSDDIKILANSDIYFDDSISVLNKLNMHDDTLYIGTRVDVTKKGDIVPSTAMYGDGGREVDPDRSQDVWIYKNINLKFNSDFILGEQHCDGQLRVSAQKGGVNVVSLFPHLRCIHVDWRRSKPEYTKGYEMVERRPIEYWNRQEELFCFKLS